MMQLIARASAPIPLGATPQDTAYTLGAVNAARELDEWIKEVNLQCWLLMHREAHDDASGEMIVEER